MHLAGGVLQGWCTGQGREIRRSEDAHAISGPCPECPFGTDDSYASGRGSVAAVGHREETRDLPRRRHTRTLLLVRDQLVCFKPMIYMRRAGVLGCREGADNPGYGKRIRKYRAVSRMPVLYRRWLCVRQRGVAAPGRREGMWYPLYGRRTHCCRAVTVMAASGPTRVKCLAVGVLQRWGAGKGREIRCMEGHTLLLDRDRDDCLGPTIVMGRARELLQRRGAGKGQENGCMADAHAVSGAWPGCRFRADDTYASGRGDVAAPRRRNGTGILRVEGTHNDLFVGLIT